MNSETNTTSEAIPKPTLEHLLASSLYAVEVGLDISGPLEHVIHGLLIRLAAERKASKDVYDMMAGEARKYQARFKLERTICNDVIEDNADLEAQLETLIIEADLNAEALQTAQERLELALATVDELSASFNWDGLLDG